MKGEEEENKFDRQWVWFKAVEILGLAAEMYGCLMNKSVIHCITKIFVGITIILNKNVFESYFVKLRMLLSQTELLVIIFC